MAKKKKAKLKRNDSRGYATSSKPKPPTSSSQKVSVNSKAQAGIKNILSEITAKNDDNGDNYGAQSETIDMYRPPDEDIQSHRFLKKVTKIYDNLSKHGFTEQQIELVIQTLVMRTENDGVTLSFESALDWLCVNLPEEELPSFFIEANDETVSDFSQDAKLSAITVIKADSKLASSTKEHSDIKFEDNPSFESSNNETKINSKIKARKDEEEANKAKEAQKAWLLEQYEYEDNDGEDEKVDEPISMHIANNSPVTDDNTQELSAEEIYLSKLELELDQLDRDLNDEASNYMRSKHEIKELKKQRKQLDGNIRRLRGRLEKQKKAETSNDEVNVVQPTKTPEITEESNIIEEDEEEVDMFSMFEEETNDVSPSIPQTTETSQSSIIQSTEPAMTTLKASIPKNWTGKTPCQILQEHCQKNKSPKPKYIKLAHNSSGCRITISASNKKNSIQIENEGPFATFKDAQEYLATEALYELNPALPLYRLFPPFFRELWMSWLNKIDEEKQARSKEEHDMKVEKMQNLIKSIAKNIEGNATKQKVVKRVVEEPLVVAKEKSPQTNQQIYDSWEHNDHDETNHAENRINKSSQYNPKKQTVNGEKIRQEFHRNCQSKSYQKMLSQRKKLPMYSYRSALLSSIDENPVTVLCGETGCGKTTQCPQYILEQAIANNCGDSVNIICTQPRRVAAMSVAERVAEEFGMNRGNVGGMVGYHIRMEAKKSDKTRLLFCTTGVILRRLQDDPRLNGVTHVVVDEVHERQWQIDFLLIALRKLITTTRKDLKVLLMSATLDSKLFCNFFSNAPFLSVPGRTFPVSNFYLEDLMDATNHFIEEYSPYAKKKDKFFSQMESMHITGRGGIKTKEMVSIDSEYEPIDVSDDYIGYKMSTRRSMDRVDENVINYDLIEDVLGHLLLEANSNKTLVAPKVESHQSDSTNITDFGATLIFLPGLAEIRILSERLKGSRSFGRSEKFDIIALHSTLSASDQRRAFQPSKKGCRKIILATNIAETSVTIPDVICVIDTGLVREIRQNERTSTSTLVTDWCSKASAKQRGGRAGRVRPGLCCKLYSSKTAERTMRDQAIPELQRVPLEEVCLSILAGGLSSNCMEFLTQAPQPPSQDSVKKALLLLEEVGAIESHDDSLILREELSPLGYHLAKLPVHVRIGKMLIYGCLFQCLDKILTIAATISCKSPFSNHVDNASQASAAHRTFTHPTSDFLTFCNVWDAYKKAKSEGSSHIRKFCAKMYLNRTALLEINDARRQFFDLLRQIGFVNKDDSTLNSESLDSTIYNLYGKSEKLINAVICAGFYPNIAHVVKEPSGGVPCLWHKKERVYFHNSSVNHGKTEFGSEWILFHEKFATSRVFVSLTSVTQPFSLLLFGRNIHVVHLERKVIVDDVIELRVSAKTGVMFREVRTALQNILKDKMITNKNLDESRTEKIIAGIVQLVAHE